MVSSPGPKHVDPTRQLRQELDEQKTALRQLANRQPFPFQVVYDPSGVGTPPFVSMFAVTNSGFTDTSGHPIPTTTIRDAQGNIIFDQIPVTFTGSVATAWAYVFWDAAGQRLIATDGKSGTGLALPYIPVPMTQLWAPPLKTATASGYSTAAASSVIGMGTLWEGRVGYCSHPAIGIDGVWGDLDASGPVITYQLVVGSQTFTWTQANNTGQASFLHRFDIHAQVGSSDLPVRLSVTSIGTATGTDRILCEVLGVHLRQTPTAFG